MPELNREEIIKALECCKSPKLTKCNGCPREEEDGLCMYRLNEDALALIKQLIEEKREIFEEFETSLVIGGFVNGEKYLAIREDDYNHYKKKYIGE